MFESVVNLKVMKAEAEALAQKQELLFGYMSRPDSGYREQADEVRDAILRQSWAMSDYRAYLWLRIELMENQNEANDASAAGTDTA